MFNPAHKDMPSANSNNNNGNNGIAGLQPVGGPIPPAPAVVNPSGGNGRAAAQQSAVPQGLNALHSLFNKVYPEQLNPLTVTAIVKFWLGGPDPLDYISMYDNPGDREQGVPPHWHYISCGLSDLHGDGRVHPLPSTDLPTTPSGFGFELSFRLRRKIDDKHPPTWPANIMQQLARYVFNTNNLLVPGDHVSWHSPLDGGTGKINQILMSKDPQLPTTRTPLGEVSFVQIIGVTSDELDAAQRWNGEGVVHLLKSPAACSAWLVTDMTRTLSIMRLEPSAAEMIRTGFEREGSNLSGVSALCSWTEASYGAEGTLAGESHARDSDSGADSEAIVKSAIIKTERMSPCDQVSSMSPDVTGRKLRGLHVTFNAEAGKLLPLAIKGRVLHGRHFTFKSILSNSAITFVTPTVTGALVSKEKPFVVQGPWLQVLLPDEVSEKMAQEFEILNAPERLQLPHTFYYADHKLAISIVNE